MISRPANDKIHQTFRYLSSTSHLLHLIECLLELPVAPTNSRVWLYYTASLINFDK